MTTDTDRNARYLASIKRVAPACMSCDSPLGTHTPTCPSADRLRAIHRDDWDRGVRLADRMRSGLCTVDYNANRTPTSWCLTHGVADDPGHAYTYGSLSTLD